MIIWNPWHGCHKVSEGCDHCYMYFLDGKRGIDTSVVTRTMNFDMPLQRDRRGRFRLRPECRCMSVCLQIFLLRRLMSGEWRLGE